MRSFILVQDDKGVFVEMYFGRNSYGRRIKSLRSVYIINKIDNIVIFIYSKVTFVSVQKPFLWCMESLQKASTLPKTFHNTTCLAHKHVNGSQLAKMKKSIPDMSLP